MAPAAAQRPSMVDVVARLEAANRQASSNSRDRFSDGSALQKVPVEPLPGAMLTVKEEGSLAKAAGGGSSPSTGQHEVESLNGCGRPADMAASDSSSATAPRHEAVSRVSASAVPNHGEEGAGRRALAKASPEGSPPKRPTSAVAQYDTAALAKVPPSPFAALA
jgi:hypothetical protein